MAAAATRKPMPEADLAAGRRVLALEAAALGRLAEGLDDAGFGRAVALLAGAIVILLWRIRSGR